MEANHPQRVFERLNAQDKAIISELYDQYAPTLYGIILKIVRSETIAEDVLQDSFIKIWQNGATFNAEKGSLFTWMLNIVRNTAIDKTRSAAFRRLSKRQPLDVERYDGRDDSASREAEHIGLKKIVSSLEEKYKVIIELLYFHGYTQREVQQYLGIPLGTVKSRTRIALRELRRFFEEQNVIALLLLFQAMTSG